MMRGPGTGSPTIIDPALTYGDRPGHHYKELEGGTARTGQLAPRHRRPRDVRARQRRGRNTPLPKVSGNSGTGQGGHVFAHFP